MAGWTPIARCVVAVALSAATTAPGVAGYTDTITNWNRRFEYYPFEYLRCGDFDFSPTPPPGNGFPCGCDNTIVGQANAFVSEGCDANNDAFISRDGYVDDCRVEFYGPDVLRSFLRFLRDTTFSTNGNTDVTRVVRYELFPNNLNQAEDYFVIDDHLYVAFSNTYATDYKEALDTCSRRNRDWFGLAGYAAALETQVETQKVRERLAADDFYVGLTDTGREGEWKWVTGPEACAPYDLDRLGYRRSACDLGIGLIRDTNDDCDAAATPQCTEGLPLWGDAYWIGGAVPGDGDFGSLEGGVNGYDSNTFDGIPVLCEWGGIGESCLGDDLFGTVYFGEPPVRTDAPPTPTPPTPAPPTDAPVSPRSPAPPTPVPSTPMPPTPVRITGSPPTPAPPTQAPPTPAPATDAPPTSVPATDVPRTPSPPTSVPPTPAPRTSIPPTPIPETGAPPALLPPTPPPTPAPPTPAPATDAPPTSVPATDVPRTPSPPTSIPPTPAPRTSIPPTPIPETGAPPTLLPPTPPPPTPLPPTPVPPTPAPQPPATPAPLTPFPPTPTPPTSAPPTFVPETEAPASPAPRTPAPPTPSPLTPTPDTDAPPTPAPPTTDPPATESPVGGLAKAKEKSLKTTSEVTSAAVVLSGGGALNAGKLALARDFGCDVDDVDLALGEPLDFEFHPTGVAIGEGASRYLVGAVVMNTALLVGFTGVVYAVAYGAARSRGHEEGMALLKFPGVALVPYMFLLPGVSLASARLMFSPLSTGYTVLGVVYLIVLCGTVAGLYLCVLRRVPHTAHLAADQRLFRGEMDEDSGAVLTGAKRKLYEFAFGSMIWVSNGEGYFCDKYGIVFDSYREGMGWMLLAEIALNLSLGAISGWKPSGATACNVRNIIISLMFAGFFCAAAVLRPFLAALDNAVLLVIAGLTATALCAMTMGIAFELPQTSAAFVVAFWALLLSAFVVMGKGVWDMLIYVVDVCMDRRAGARRAAREKAREEMLGGSSREEMVQMEAMEEREPTPLLAALSPNDVRETDMTRVSTPLLGGASSLPSPTDRGERSVAFPAGRPRQPSASVFSGSPFRPRSMPMATPPRSVMRPRSHRSSLGPLETWDYVPPASASFSPSHVSRMSSTPSDATRSNPVSPTAPRGPPHTTPATLSGAEIARCAREGRRLVV